jgi:hypothetical protein
MDACRDNRMTLEALQGRSYIRFNQMKHLLSTHQLDNQLRSVSDKKGENS